MSEIIIRSLICGTISAIGTHIVILICRKHEREARNNERNSEI